MIGFGMDGNVMGGPGAFGSPGALGAGPLDSIEDRDLQDAVARAVLGIDQSGNPQDIGQSIGNLEQSLNMSINPGYGFGIPGQAMNIAQNHPQGLSGVLGQLHAGTTPGLTQGYNFSEALGNIIGGNIANFQGQQGFQEFASPHNTGWRDPGKRSMRQAMATDVMSGLLGNPNAINMNEAMDFATVANFVNQNDQNTSLNYDENGNLIGFTEAPVESLGVGTTVSFDDSTPYGYQGPIYGPNYDNTPLGLNPLSTILESLKNIELEEYKDNPNPAWPGVQNFINRTVFSQDNNVEPSIELYDPTDITPSTSLGANAILDTFGIENRSPTSQQEVDALMDNVLGMQFEDGINFDPYDMSMAMASVEENPWGYNQSVVDAINASYDTGAISSVLGPEAGGEALAQRAAETIIAQQAARQVTPQSNKVTIPTSSGPDIAIDVTPPAPQTSVAPQRRTAPPPSPVQVAAKSIAKPKAFKALPKFAQKEIRQGKVPTTGSDYVQDMVRDFLGGQKAVGDSGTRK